MIKGTLQMRKVKKKKKHQGNQVLVRRVLRGLDFTKNRGNESEFYDEDTVVVV
jgi:hypothetical protein